MEIHAQITGIEYKPLLCRKLTNYRLDCLKHALDFDTTFILDLDNLNRIAISWWKSAKRTRTYPYARVYDSLNFIGKKVTIIPVYKDEGKDGDRDFLQWDTISLMSLLGVYVIIGYYINAVKNPDYENKITHQKFDIGFLNNQIKELASYQSDALHWNLRQIDNIGEIGRKALDSYINISKNTSVNLKSAKSAERRINKLLIGKAEFMNLSRDLAEKAAKRESVTKQPKEKLSGTKATLTIKNYLGGKYYLTADEVEISGDTIYIIEGKHTKEKDFPALGDIKDGLLKMTLFCNFSSVTIDGTKYQTIPVLKLSVENGINFDNLTQSKQRLIDALHKEAELNKFELRLI